MAGLVLCAAAVAVFLLLRDNGTEITPPTPPPSHTPDVVTREETATELLNRLTDVLAHGSREDAVALAKPGGNRSVRTVTTLFDNAHRLRVTDLSMRYIDEDLADGTTASAPNQWSADVEVTWRLARFDTRPSELELSFTFADQKASAALVDVSAEDEGAALWLLDELAVERSRRALVMVTDPETVERTADLANQAVRDVKKVLPAWRGRLVVEVPDSQSQLDEVLGAEPESYSAIAAITSTVDGSNDSSAPTHIFINPEVFSGLGDAGAQIVLSHEATHVATQAATSSMAMWLLEGFADYVALAHVDLPVSITASQILAQVEEQGVPEELPGEEEFDPSNAGLGATYESAWLACRLIAQQYGEDRLIELYEAADSGTPIGEAFWDVLGTDEASFTAQWREYLRQLGGRG